MKVLVACEFSGTVRRAFNDAGHDAWSVDLLPAADRSNRHITGDARAFLNEGWDMLIVAHPPCTRLCLSGVRWLHEAPGKLEASHYSAKDRAAYAAMTPAARLAFMWAKLDEGAQLFNAFWTAPIARVCVENPIMHKHARQRVTDWQEPQYVQPCDFGHAETKKTGLWLKNLPRLTPTNRVKPTKTRVHSASPGAERWKERSRFFDGIAHAMAAQWGQLGPTDYEPLNLFA
jgi:hypothetical protein